VLNIYLFWNIVLDLQYFYFKNIDFKKKPEYYPIKQHGSNFAAA